MFFIQKLRLNAPPDKQHACGFRQRLAEHQAAAAGFCCGGQLQPIDMFRLVGVMIVTAMWVV